MCHNHRVTRAERSESGDKRRPESAVRPGDRETGQDTRDRVTVRVRVITGKQVRSNNCKNSAALVFTSSSRLLYMVGVLTDWCSVVL